MMPSTQTYIYIAIGLAIILIAVVIYVGRHLYKRSKRKDLERNDEISIPPNRTAADNLEEEVTQKILDPLRTNTIPLSLLKEKPSVNSIRNSKSFNRRVESRLRLKNGSNGSKTGDGSRISSRTSSKPDSLQSINSQMPPPLLLPPRL
jgi:hypothetical protein